MMKRIICFLLALMMLIPASYVSASDKELIISKEGKLPFKDVISKSWYEDSVEFCYVNSIVTGMKEDEFHPSSNLTRAQFVTMLANLEGIDKDSYGTDIFRDVKRGHWFYGYIGWAYEKGIVNGITETEFLPNANLTRAQLAVIMKNYMESKYTVEIDYELMEKYSDKPKEEYWYYDAVSYAVSAGLISGISEDTLGATANVTRAQICRIMMLFVQNYKCAGHEHIYAEADCVTSRVCSECGMVEGLPTGHLMESYDCAVGGVCTVCNEKLPPNGEHDYAVATCTKPETCTVCGGTRGEVAPHNWKNATCQAPKTCSGCGLTEGSKINHSFTYATCTKPETCTMCGTTRGKAYGHKNGTWCVFCQDIIAELPYDRIKCQIGMFGQPDTATGAWYFKKDTKNSTTWIAYFPLDDKVTIENVYYYEDDTYDSIEIIIGRNGICEYIYGYIQDGEYMFMGYGTLDASTFTKNTKEGFSTYRGKLYSQYTENMNMALNQMISEADELIRRNLNGTIRDLGFKLF